MPAISPPEGETGWPGDEGTLGVVGVAPWATLEFCRELYARVGASKDWHYPRVLIDINTKIPSRGRHLQLGESDPSEAIAATIGELARQGATVAVVVCNTAHILYDRWASGAPIPILNIIEETLACAVARGASRIAPLVSASLSERDLYGVRARRRGLACALLSADDQRVVEKLIEAVKVSGRLGSAEEPALRALVERIAGAGADTVIAGCTELSGVSSFATQAGLCFVDSNAALAGAALRELRVPPGRLRTA
jgi:aspartate racemase